MSRSRYTSTFLQGTRIALIAIAVGMTITTEAGEARPVVQAEINSLLNRLETSGCGFNRNGTWYSGIEAKSHMLAKLHYIESRTALQNTEQFIELAATRSSVSGKPYVVKCGNGPGEPSATWLTKQLQSLRGARPGGSDSTSGPAALEHP
ncbi:DUF5329 domain-containing protein [Paraburkholderia sp. RCC_158]|uniref:DUF5329 domain-containing protein n=1 Tax=Paraburkholderia sp. RCC_158 TaxID=3239220 RepID=UPI0035241066